MIEWGQLADYQKFVPEKYAQDMYMPTHTCPHGYGDNCECKLPRFRSIYAVRVRSKVDGVTRQHLARLRMVHDGGMIQFHDPISDEVVGCCGVNRLSEFCTYVYEWLDDLALSATQKKEDHA